MCRWASMHARMLSIVSAISEMQWVLPFSFVGLHRTCCWSPMTSLRKRQPITPLPPPQERYQEYRRCMAEQQLSPVRLRAFFKHTDERGVPAL